MPLQLELAARGTSYNYCVWNICDWSWKFVKTTLTEWNGSSSRWEWLTLKTVSGMDDPCTVRVCHHSSCAWYQRLKVQASHGYGC